MEKRNHYSVDDVYQFSLNVLEAAGYNKTKSKSTAYALLEADKRGIFSHGTAGGTGIEESVKRSGITATVRLDTEPIILDQKYPTITIIDAKGSPGHYSSDIAVDLVKKLAREYGYGKVFVNNANHYGAAGVWSHKIAEDGDLKGVSTCTTVAVARVLGDDPERLDYTKGAGKENRLGTNPLAISIPYQEGILTFDTAWTRMAVSYCLKQLKSGEMMTIPEYIGDQNFKSTLDPKGFADSMETLSQAKGTVFPHGSTLAGYKGDSMLRFIEIDNSLGGGPIEKIPLGAQDERRRISHTFEAQALDVLYTVDDAKKRVKDLMKDYKSKYFGFSSRWPGDRAQEALEYSIREGIPYSKGQIESLQRTADYTNIEFSLEPISTKLYPSSIFNK
jgi:L-2-hydroxycarboxylate dehydrogenase (NAD+)